MESPTPSSESVTYPLTILLIPGRINERLAQRAKYKLFDDSECYFFQTRCLDNDVRVNEYFQDCEYMKQIPTPDGVQLKLLSPSGPTILSDGKLPDYNAEYVLEHDGMVVFYWEKAIVLDFLDSYKSDHRVVVSDSNPIGENYDEESIPTLL